MVRRLADPHLERTHPVYGRWKNNKGDRSRKNKRNGKFLRRANEIPLTVAAMALALTVPARMAQHWAAGTDDAERRGPTNPMGDRLEHTFLAVTSTRSRRMGSGPTTDSDFPTIAGIDTCQARWRMDGDVTLFAGILRTLVDQHDAAVGFVRQDVLAGRLPEAATRLHRLRGAVGAVSAESLAAACREAELALRERRTAALLPLLDAIEGAFASLLAAVRDYLASRAADVVEVGPPAEIPDLIVLLSELRAHNAGAIDRFSRLRGGILARCGRDVADQCAAAIDKLRFDTAAEILSHALSRAE